MSSRSCTKRRATYLRTTTRASRSFAISAAIRPQRRSSRSFHEALSGFAESLGLGTNAAVEEGYRLILDVLGWNLIRQRYPKLYVIMQILSFAEDVTSPFAGASEKSEDLRPWGHQVPLPTTLDRLISAAGFELPGYLAGGLDGEDTARRVTDLIVLTALTGLKVTGIFTNKVKKMLGMR